MLDSLVQREDHPVCSPKLRDGVTRHRLVIAGFVDHDLRAQSTGGDIDSPDLVVPGRWTGEVFDDVEGRAVGRERVVFEFAGQLHDSRCGLGPAFDERHLDDGEPAMNRRRVGGLPVLDKDSSLPVRRYADRGRVGADRRQPPATFERLRRATEARLDDEVADGRRRSVSGRSQHTTPCRVRDAVGQVVQHLAGARQDDARTRDAGASDHEPGIPGGGPGACGGARARG